jgi:DNA-binding IclR family transcriptional regulator
MAGEGGRTGSKARRSGLRVFKYLATGDILEWKSVRQVAAELTIGTNEAYGALEDLVTEGLAEKSDRGFRQSPQGLSFYAVQVQEALARAVKQLGIAGQAGEGRFKDRRRGRLRHWEENDV